MPRSKPKPRASGTVSDIPSEGTGHAHIIIDGFKKAIGKALKHHAMYDKRKGRLVSNAGIRRVWRYHASQKGTAAALTTQVAIEATMNLLGLLETVGLTRATRAGRRGR